MKHVGLALFLVGAWIGLLSGTWAQTAVAPAAGDGLTTSTAYQITELGNLVWLHDQAAAGATSGKYYKLMNDIDASDTANWNDSGTDASVLEGFDPIGGDLIPPITGPPYNPSFKGAFDGAGHEITGLMINRSSNYCVGLFGVVGSGGEVKNLGIVGGAVTGYIGVGGLVGENDGGTVSACYATGTVTGSVCCGDLVGENGGGTVSACHAAGSVLASDTAGGLVGNNSGRVSACCAAGSVTGSSCVGGLVAENGGGTVSACYATGSVTGSDTSTGGLVGGSDDGTISACYATGTVRGNHEVGGLAGTTDGGTVSACYATGSVTGSGDNVGGLIGAIWSGAVPDSYWNTETSGKSSSGGGTGMTTARMKQQSTFVNWDFISIWGIQGAYPYLRVMSTHALTYVAGTHGLIGDGLTTGTTLMQTVNTCSTGTAVAAVADTGYQFTRWSDGWTDNPRTDANVTADLSVTAIFAMRARTRDWLQYQ